MPNHKNDEANIGKRIGRLLQQYGLRIEYAKYKANLMEEERKKSSACNQTWKAAQASVSKKAWEVYADNLATKKDELIEAVKGALICYNSKERLIWWLYFIENKSTYEIEEEVKINSRSVQRCIAAMKEEMALKFEQSMPRMGDTEAPKWSSVDLARFLEDKPSDDYIAAVKDMLAYGIVDVDALEFDPDFQDCLAGKR